jgi:hypothetical protein
MNKIKHNHQWQRVQRTPILADEKHRQERNTATLKSNEFNELCDLYKVDPTTRQASKYNRKKGLLYKLSKKG